MRADGPVLDKQRNQILKRCSLARNVEVKARLAAPEQVRLMVERLSGTAAALFGQTDHYYDVPKGRLKLRECGDQGAQLIYYNRPDQTEPTLSVYEIAPVSDAAKMIAVLECIFGDAIVVRKKRRLHLMGQTRIHLDEVEGLGHFLELEVVLREGQKERDAERIAADLVAQLNLGPIDMIDVGYLELTRDRVHID